MDADISMDTTQDLQSSPGGVVRWVASQSPNPALQALIREAERDRRTRPSTPVHKPMSWTYPLASTTSSASLSTSVSSASHSSGHNSTDASYPSPLSGSSSSSLSLAPRASELSVSRRPKPLSAAQRRPLASSTSSANQPPRHSARLRSSSHSTVASKRKYTPKDDEPEALFFIELLKDASRQVDRNSEIKEREAWGKGKGKEREQSLGRSGIDNRTGLDTNNLGAQPLTKTTSAFAVPSTRAPEKTLGASMSACRPEPRGRALAKTASLGAPVHLISGKSIPTSLPNPNLKCDPKLVPAPWLPAGASNTSNANHPTACKASFPETTSNDGDSAMQDIIDLGETDTEWERPTSGPISRADTTTYMQVDDEESDTGMDMSFFKPKPAPHTRVPAPKPKPQPTQPTRSLVPTPTQRTRSGPPPLGMRRTPQLQPSQYNSTQGSKGLTVPRFKPPLLANAGGTTNKNGSGPKPAMATSSRQPPRGGATKVPAAETAARTSQDPDSSFDISFDVDADALEEAMRAYD